MAGDVHSHANSRQSLEASSGFNPVSLTPSELRSCLFEMMKPEHQAARIVNLVPSSEQGDGDAKEQAANNFPVWHRCRVFVVGTLRVP
jgi:hypothetical protein